MKVRTVGFEPTLSCACDQRCASVPGGIPGFPTSCSSRAPAGVDPTSTGLRDRCIASFATTPIVSRSGRNRTSGLDLISVLLWPLSYAPSGAGGTRTRIRRIKSPVPIPFGHDPACGTDLSVSMSPALLHPPKWKPRESNSATRGYQPRLGNQPSATVHP